MADIVQPDSYLTLHYRIALIDDSNTESGGAGFDRSADASDRETVIADTFDGNPATLQMGIGQLPPALEGKLIGLGNGESASFNFDAGEAFGARNAELVQKLSRSTLDAESDAEADYAPGDVVEFNPPGGTRYAGVLKELNERYALFDFNHPLAGRPVRFDVRIIGVI